MIQSGARKPEKHEKPQNNNSSGPKKQKNNSQRNYIIQPSLEDNSNRPVSWNFEGVCIKQIPQSAMIQWCCRNITTLLFLSPPLACRYVGVENAIIRFIRERNGGLSQHVAEVVKFCPELHTDLAGHNLTNKKMDAIVYQIDWEWHSSWKTSSIRMRNQGFVGWTSSGTSALSWRIAIFLHGSASGEFAKKKSPQHNLQLVNPCGWMRW